MKKKKIVKPFYFVKEKTDVVNELNNTQPINIKQFESIINIIHSRYPLIDKADISLIVRSVFETLREFLLFGYVINLNKFIFDMKLHFFKYKDIPALKVKIKTPPKLKGI